MIVFFLAALLLGSFNLVSTAQAQAFMGQGTATSGSSISGTVGEWQGGTGYALLLNGVTTEADGSLTMHGPVYSGVVGADGVFTINLGTPAANEMNWRGFCPESNFDGALVGAVIIANSPRPTRADQVSLFGTYGVYGAAGEVLNPSVSWIYTANARQHSGNCGNTTMSLALQPGWTMVVTNQVGNARSFDTRPLPDNAVWIFSPYGQ